jgi:hypothetical protein
MRYLAAPGTACHETPIVVLLTSVALRPVGGLIMNEDALTAAVAGEDIAKGATARLASSNKADTEFKRGTVEPLR